MGRLEQTYRWTKVLNVAGVFALYQVFLGNSGELSANLEYVRRRR